MPSIIFGPYDCGYRFAIGLKWHWQGKMYRKVFLTFGHPFPRVKDYLWRRRHPQNA